MTVQLIQLCKRSCRKCKKDGFYLGAPSLAFFYPDFPNPFYAPATRAISGVIQFALIMPHVINILSSAWQFLSSKHDLRSTLWNRRHENKLSIGNQAFPLLIVRCGHLQSKNFARTYFNIIAVTFLFIFLRFIGHLTAKPISFEQFTNCSVVKELR